MKAWYQVGCNYQAIYIHTYISSSVFIGHSPVDRHSPVGHYDIILDGFCCEMCRTAVNLHRQTDRQAARQAGRQAGSQAGRQAGRLTGRQTAINPLQPAG